MLGFKNPVYAVSWNRFILVVVRFRTTADPTAFEQNATMEGTSVHEDPNLLRVGVPRTEIIAAFGTPNQIVSQNGQEEDVYEFNPDSSEFVKPKIFPRNIAAGVFTHGIATVVHQARIYHAEQQFTIYHVTDGPDGTMQSVRKEWHRNASSDKGAAE